MKYQDALEVCLKAAREGRDVSVALEAFPEHADRLGDEVTLALILRESAAALPEPPVEASVRALQAVETQLRAARQAQVQRPASRGFFTLPRFATALTVLVIALGALAALTGVVGSPAGTAEAMTFEGIVVESAEGYVLVQTDTQLEKIDLAPDVALVGPDGTGVPSLSAGQPVVVTARRLARGIAATRIQLQVAQTVEAWCGESVERCEQLQERLQTAVDECSDRPDACAARRPVVEAVRVRVAAAVRIEALKERCRSGEIPVCRELIEVCRDRPDACGNIERRLLEQIEQAPALPDEPRIIALRMACRQGDAAACATLRELCAASDRILCEPLLLPRPEPTTAAPLRVAPADTAPTRPLPTSTPTPLQQRQDAPALRPATPSPVPTVGRQLLPSR